MRKICVGKDNYSLLQIGIIFNKLLTDLLICDIINYKVKILSNADMVEMADTWDLGSHS